MKPCSPLAWSDRRLLVGVAGLVASTMVVATVGGSVPVVVFFIAAYVTLDGAALALAGIRRSRLRVALSVGPDGDRPAIVTGGVARLEATVEVSSGSTSAFLAPVVPPTMELLPPGGARGMVAAGRSEVAIFRLRARQAGEIVFPGVLLRRWSPLRLFSRARFVPDRTVACVLPDVESSSHPLVARVLRSTRRPGGGRRYVIRGLGSDFRELRPYRYPDPMRRVDWKATARRQELVVREYEAPPEFTIRILLEGSLDMTRGEGGRAGFDNAADLVGKLAAVAGLQQMSLVLTVFDRALVLEHRLGGGATGLSRVLAALVSVPRLALERTVASAPPGEVAAAATRAARRALGRRERPVGSGEEADARRREMLADLDPDGARDVGERCPACGRRLFADEARCTGCGADHGAGDLAPRAACLCGLLARGLRAARGREMLVLLTTLRGGEMCPQLVDLLRLAAAGHRTVHVVLPTIGDLEDARPLHAGSLGHAPERWRMLRDIDRLQQSARFAAFRRRLEEAGAHLHALDDRADLDGVVADLLRSEVLAA